MELIEFKPYLDTLTYDKYYQDITCIGFKGYSESHKTWASIKNEVTWSGKKVADLGCFHGYFSFQAAKLNANVIGFDRSPDVIKTTDIINDFEGNIIETRVWKDTDKIPETFDIILCLNVLHHFENPDQVLRSIKCNIGIFEINIGQEELVKKHFEITKRIPSHREGRIILITKKEFSLGVERMFTESRIFVTGIYGSGKTMYAKAYAKESGLKYIDFDKYFSYAKVNPNLSATSEENLYNILADKFVIDAIPFSAENGSTRAFMQYARSTDVRIVCCVCPSKAVWADRVLTVKKMAVDINRYGHYCVFYYKTLPIYSEFKIDYYDTCANEYITKDQMYSRIAWIKPLLDFL